MNERPVNPAQATAFFLQAHAPSVPHQNVQLSLSLGERWPIERLQQAWQHAVAAHGMLRSGFRQAGVGEFFRQEHATAEIPWNSLDWQEVPPTEIPARWSTLMTEDAAKPFDLATPPLLRITTITLPGGHCHSLVSFPRLLLDEDGLFQILCEWLDALEGHARPIAIDEGEFPSPADRVEWWKQTLAAAPQPVQLEIASLPAGQAEAGRSFLATTLARDVSKAIKSAAQSAGISNRDFFLGAWSFLLSRLTSRERVLFLAHTHLPLAVPTDGGLAENLLPFLVEPSGTQTIAEYLKKLARTEKERLENAGLPLDLALSLAQPPLSAESFVTSFHWAPPSLNSRIHDAYPRWINLDAKLYRLSATPLALEVRDDTPFELRLDYDAAVLPAAQAEQLLKRLRQALEEFSQDINGKLNEACILDDTEWATFRLVPPSSDAPPSNVGFLEKIESAVSTHGKVIAAEGAEGATLSYDELDSHADALAAYLRRENLADGWNIAICLTPTSWLPVAILATLRAGNTCLPLDPLADSAWLTRAVEAGDAELVICDSRSAPAFEGTSKKLLIIDQQWESIGEETPPQAAPAKIPFLLASADPEKGVLCRPINPALLSVSAEMLARRLDLQPGERLALLPRAGTSAFAEILVAGLGAGATLLLEEEGNFAQIADSAAHLRLTSRQWRAWVASHVAEDKPLASELRSVSVEAAAFPPALYARWQRLNQGQARWSTFLTPTGFSGQAVQFVSPDAPGVSRELARLPVGTPAWGVKSRLNDHAGQPMAPLYPGTLEVSLKKDAEVRYAAPAWRDAHGDIFLVPSPLDRIEHALCEFPNILDAHAGYDKKGAPLVWVILADRSEQVPAGLWEQVAPHLPAGFPAESLLAVREFPLTAHGEIDAAQLPYPAPPPAPLPVAKPTPAAPKAEPAAPRVVKEWVPLVPLSQTPDTPTLFLIHGLDGDPSAYQTLATLLAEDWTVYGTSARGLADPRSCHASVEAEATALVEAIIRQETEGPCHLCGHGYGATLAFEIARQLRASGRDVPYLMLAGGTAPEPEAKPNWRTSLARVFGGKSPKQPAPTGPVTPVVEAHLRALKDYKPAPLTDPAGLILGADQGAEAETAWENCVPDFFLERMSCSAADMLKEPAVKRLAVILRDCALAPEDN